MVAGGWRKHFGAGPAALRLEEIAEGSRKRQRVSLTFARTSGPTRKPAAEALFEEWVQYSKPDWDGEEARAVPPDRLRSAIALVEALPLTVPAPEACADRDGDFCLEWHRGPRRTISVSIGAAGVLHWAAVIGDDDPRGTWRFSPDVGDDAPEMLRYLLGRIYR
ncbi:MAG: hypothetical protein ACKO9B_18055 [Planctomycetota bacterium]